MVVLDNITANHKTYPLILTTYLVLRHQFRFKRNIERLYNDEKLSAREVAAKLGSSHSSINTAVKKLELTKPIKIRRPRFGRPTPNKSETQSKKELKTIALILDLKRQGFSLGMIARHLNNNKINTPSGSGSWVKSTVKRLLNNN